jgi:hypothetical protein
MPVQTFRQLLAEHSFNRDEYVYAFSWRHGPKGKLTVYDLNMPRRYPITEDSSHGHAEDDWWIHSTALSISDIEMAPYNGLFWESSCKACDWVYVDTQPHRNCMKCGNTSDECVKSPGYKNTLIGLLSMGCLTASRSLSDWVEDDSRKWALPHTRLFYKEN